MIPSRSAGLVSLLIALGLGGAVAGCAGSGTWDLQVSNLASRYLPTTREVDYPPDSLGALTIRETDEKILLEISTDYEGLHRRWSSSYQVLGVGRSFRGRSYATFWSKELSLASLQVEAGISALTKERAQKLLAQRRREYRDALQFDIYWFESEGSPRLAGPGGRVELEIDGETYRPARESISPLRQTFLVSGEGQALYRRNTFYFDRTVDGTDILDGASRMVLTVSRAGAASRVRFAWEWPERAG